MASSFASSPLLRSPAPLNLHADRFGFNCKEDMRILGRRTGSPAFQVVVWATKDSNKEVAMVDPLEAKRLAAKEMQEMQAKKKYKRKREIEAINGGWAMIGLTAGLVVEGHTGNGILKHVN